MIPGYQVRDQIHNGAHSIVYQAVRVDNQQPVILKVLRRDYPTAEELTRYRHEYKIIRSLKLAGVVKAFGLETYQHTLVMVIEDFGGQSLNRLTSHQAWLLEQFFPLAIQITKILGEIHAAHIIHKDINPSNLVFNPTTGIVKIIDFSIATQLNRIRPSLKSPNILEGTLPYLSPEQTGRMNCSLDYRSDFYSLGATFYEFLTGQRPFAAQDALELVHCHLAIQPPLPDQINASIPPTLSRIVMKLMAKNAEDRYQSSLGLTHDLERCFQQWEAAREINLFELGEQDICDRFVVPEKLYGRETEVQILLEAFARVSQGTSELVLVAGFSGVGKTAVVNEVHKPITRQKGYFIKGKYDQLNRNIPFSAFVQAFRSLMEQLLSESDVDLANWKTQIVAAVGESGQVLIEVIPELERIIGAQPPVPELSGSAAQNRFNLLFGKFVQVFATQDHPLVIFLDDLQWVDSASLNLLKLLMEESETGYLLVLGAYRDNEVFSAHPLMLTLADLQKQGKTVKPLTLEPLSAVHINRLVADTLLCSIEIAAPLSQLVYQKTRGNPFFSTQFLQGVYGDGWITFEQEVGYWQCDLSRVRQLALTDDVVEFIVGRLQKLPTVTQEILKLAACIGNRFDLATLTIISQATQDAVATALWQGLQAGFVIPETETYKFVQGEPKQEQGLEDIAVGYRFLHDRVQQAAYMLIPSDQRDITHYQIGRLLLQQTPASAREEHIFELVSQLNYGAALITHQPERDELAQLNLIASRKARAATAYEAGCDYAAVGLSLLGEQAWQRQYDLSLSFHDLAADLASLRGDFEAMEQFVEPVIVQAHELLDQVNVYRTRILSHVFRYQQTEALVIGQQFLQQLGITFPATPTQQDIQQAIAEVDTALGERAVEDLIHLPRMTNRKTMAVLQILDSLLSAAHISGSLLLPLLAACAVKLSIQDGLTSISAFAYCYYGAVACGVIVRDYWQDVELGVQFGQLAFQVVTKLEDKLKKPEILCLTGLCILHRKFHIKDTLPRLQEGYAAALEIGNLEFVGYAAQNFSFNAFWCGQPLDTLEQQIRSYCQVLVQMNQLIPANYCCMHHQATLNLLGEAEDPTILSGEVFQEIEQLRQLNAAQDAAGIAFVYVHKLMLCYLFEDIELAETVATEFRPYLRASSGLVCEPAFYFYDSLIALAPLRAPSNLNSTSEEISEIRQWVDQNQQQLQQFWANYAPMNHQHKVDLVEAEKCRVLGQTLDAIELFDLAISRAKENKYIQEEALANELAAKFYLDWGKEKIAQVYLRDAHYAYNRWGAVAKVQQLAERYPNLLPQDPISSPKITTHQPTSSTMSTSQHGDALDFESLVKASQAISGELVLEQLLSTLMQILLENTGAQTGFLAFETKGQCVIEAIGSANKQIEVLQSIPLESTEANGNAPRFSASIFNYVARTQESLVLRDAFQEGNFTQDPYIQTHQVKSLLCAPLLNQTQLSGIVYLENNLTVGAFTNERLEILQLLSGQAAIAIDHARLYADLEQKVLDRTQALQDKNQELADTLDQLRSTQRQLIESEKMAALGSLVAGVAHEINTPVGTAVISASTLMTATLTIQNDWGKGNLKRSTLKNYLELASESSRLILSNLHRAGDLVQSFKQVAVDQTTLQVRTFAIKPYLEEVLANLVPQLKGTTHHLTVEGDDDLTLHSYPGAISQIVTNLVMNSLYHAYQPGEAGNLRFEIISQDPNLFIRYSDDGCGIPPENLSRVFEPFFTTGREHGGSGLGLHLVYNLVTQKLNGNIIVESALGLGATFMITLPVSVRSNTGGSN